MAHTDPRTLRVVVSDESGTVLNSYEVTLTEPTADDLGDARRAIFELADEMRFGIQ